jgi:hypothetical protein
MSRLTEQDGQRLDISTNRIEHEFVTLARICSIVGATCVLRKVALSVYILEGFRIFIVFKLPVSFALDLTNNITSLTSSRPDL